MKAYSVRLQSDVSRSFRCQKAADSLDINSEEKSIHDLSVVADLDTPFNVGLIVGSSGSGKTTLARQIYGDDCFAERVDFERPVIEQFPDAMNYDECAAALVGIGLTAVPCWIRPIKTLSNGQQARAIAALRMHSDTRTIVIDEWTSVVDRTVAKVMSHCVQKHARRSNRSVVLLSCHFDIVDWMNPDWVIDCNTQTFTDRRLLRCERAERLTFEVRECNRKTWSSFSKYHYLSSGLPSGKNFYFGLYHNGNQVGFQCFAAYVPQQPDTYYSNRTVIHPDYAGLGLGIRLINETSEYVASLGKKVRAKFSSAPIAKMMLRSDRWRLVSVERKIKQLAVYGRGSATKFNRNRQDPTHNRYRSKVTVYNFVLITY